MKKSNFIALILGTISGVLFSLGACPARNAEILRKSRIAFNGADFRGFKETQKSVEFEFDHSLSHFHAKTIKIE